VIVKYTVDWAAAFSHASWAMTSVVYA